MTVSTTDSDVEYTSGGPGFPIPFRFLQSSDIEAVLVNQNGVAETLTGAQYTVTGAGSQSGGTLTSTYAAGILATPGALLTISRIMSAVQPTDLRNQGKYLAETHETVFDRLTMLIQQSFGGLSRALLRPIGKSYYDAQGRRIANVADPVEGQDAATKGSVEGYVNDLLGTGTGPTNNAANVLYAPAGGATRTVQSRLRDVVMLTDFAGAIEGASNSAATAFSAAEASSHANIFLPYGVWNAGATVLTKRYYGLGKLITGTSYRGQQYVSLTSDPQRAVSADFSDAATADISHVNLTRFDMGRIRNNLNEYYYNSATTPFWTDTVSLAGHSGTSCKFTNALAVGATSITLIAATPEITPGMQVKISNDIVSQVVTCVTNSGTTLTFTPGLTSAMTVAYTSGPTPTYGYVSSATRTMNQQWMGHFEHQGGGDAYVYGGRMIVNTKVRQPGQDHFFEVATGGLIGGDLLNIVHGGYLTGMELSFHDTNFSGSYQTGSAGLVFSFNRTADRAVDTFGCFWMGSLFKSEGSAYADVAYRAYGKWKRGLDFTGMDLQGDRAAMTLQRLHRIYLDASGVAKDPRGFSWFADTPGGAWLGTGSGGDVVLAHGGQGRIYLEDGATRVRAKTSGDHVILDRGYLDLYTEVTATAGASQGYATVFINGVSRKIQVFAMP